MKSFKMRIISFVLCVAFVLTVNPYWVMAESELSPVPCDVCGVEPCICVEVTPCGECGQIDSHAESCSNYEFLPADVCAECGQPDAHLENCSQYVAFVEKCEYCQVELTDGAVHSDNCLTNCTCEPIDGVHAEDCKFYEVPSAEVCPDCGEVGCKCGEIILCEVCGLEVCQCASIEDNECPECGDIDGHEADCSYNEELSVFDILMAAENTDEMYVLLLNFMNSDPEALNSMSSDEISALRDMINKLDPELDDQDTAELLETLNYLPANACPECNLIGEHEEYCPRYQVEVLLPNDGYIYFDLYYGNVSITNDTYTGYVRGSDGNKNVVTGTHNNSNNYYIFQSTGNAYPADGGIPDYTRVTYNGQSWGDFITNHPIDSDNNTSTNVDQVISAWGSVEHLANSATSGAAVTAGRKPTQNYIDIKATTNNNTYNVVIDDIWSSFSTRVDNSDDNTNMDTIFAGFNYKLKSTGNTLNLKLVGDNRLGRLHCATHDGRNGQYTIDKNHTNIMTVTTLSGQDDATLTVCNITENADHGWTAAEIGGTDGTDHTVKLVFNQGTIYAGSAYGDFGSGIGGGGNGDGYVTINGGRVTAITSATGAAIGGGCGTTGPGGYGNVTITNGEVYAFNYQPCGSAGAAYSDAMPTAIGGGSSGLQIGGLGIVNISGGKVFAYSQVGNAIGGGGGGRGKLESTNYYSATGGIADVTISGGTVDAISGKGCAIGGGPGGGRGYTAANAADLHTDHLNLYADGKVSANGGTAKLTISGGTVRSGSIGGGSPLVLEDGTDYRDKYGFTVGAAVVNISDGIIHGQVVMNGTIEANTDGFDNNVHPTISGLVIGQNSSFTMIGGTIDNTPIGDQYHFVEENGGAVYINSGSAKMSGGEIRDASSPLGGAIYLQGGDFELAGSALIVDCSATQLGGAVYVKGGDVTVSGGTIQQCTAPNGGAAYVTDGNFTMSGGTIGSTAESNTNTAENGAGVYVNGGRFTMSGGKMVGNKASENGGAAYVTGGDFTMTGGIIGGEGTGEANTAINGAGVYVAGGNFHMISGIITNNGTQKDSDGNIYRKTEYGGGVFVSGGNITIGVENCSDKETTHDYKGESLPHPIVEKNEATFGGGLAVDGGTVNIYCGTISENKSDNNGTGMNIFMYDSDTVDEIEGELNHFCGTIGDEENHGMVVIGGTLNLKTDEGQTKIKINYHSNAEVPGETVELAFRIWIGEAPENYYLNLPYCPQEWEVYQNSQKLTFVGWTYDRDNDEEVEDKVDLSYIRSKDDYRALGEPVKIKNVDWKKLNDGYYIDFYAVWAPMTSSIEYRYSLDGEHILDEPPGFTTGYPSSYNYELASSSLTIPTPGISGYTFMGWKMYASKDEISNWGKDATTENKQNPNLVSQLKDIDVTSPVEVVQNFGDIVFVAIFVPAYADLKISKSGCDIADENQTFIFEISGKPANDNLEYVSMQVTIHGNGEILIKELPVGYYTISELTDWSWRYDDIGSEQVELTDPTQVKEVCFSNNRSETQWLDGDSWCDNRFTVDTTEGN